MEEIQSRIQHAVEKMISALDKEVLRKMQTDMYKCSAKCCETLDTMEDVQRCVENCSQSLNRAQSVIGQELQTYQDRLQRCTMDCQDVVRDKMSKNASESEMAKHRRDIEQCVVKCGDAHIALLPVMLKRIKETIQR